jgi:hypothetical protein
MIPVAHTSFSRNDEYKELLLYQEGSVFKVWEVTGTPSSDNMRRKQIGLTGSESQGRAQFDKESKRLRAEGFALCEPQD